MQVSTPWVLVAAGVVILAVPGAVQAGNGSRLYAPCVPCHQPTGWGSTDGLVPALAGQRRRYLEREVGLFRSGARIDTAMQIVTARRSR